MRREMQGMPWQCRLNRWNFQRKERERGREWQQHRFDPGAWLCLLQVSSRSSSTWMEIDRCCRWYVVIWAAKRNRWMDLFPLTKEPRVLLGPCRAHAGLCRFCFWRRRWKDLFGRMGRFFFLFHFFSRRCFFFKSFPPIKSIP